MGDQRPIGFFDSGVGQISIIKEVRKLLPHENFAVLADEKHLPFGEKSKESIERFTAYGMSFLIKRHKIKLLVVACNTASIQALEHIRKYFDIPIVGTVPAIKPAYLSSKNKKIAILSTNATSKSKYLDKLIKKYALDAEILKIACPGLEDAIENLNDLKIKHLIHEYTKKIKSFGADTLVLGCTHYPLVQHYFEEFLSKDVTIVDSSNGIARKVRTDLTELNILSSSKQKDVFYTTGNQEIFSRACSYYLNSKITAVKVNI